MKIHPERLHRSRKDKRLSRAELARRSNVSERTIQRLENESERTQTNHRDTLACLAKALGVEEGVLTGDIPFPDANKTPEPERVQIGAQVAPKARLAYDLIKRRYGVSTTEILNMAPLFFTLLAEESLAWRREKLGEAEEAISCLDQMKEVGYSIFRRAAIVANMAGGAEDESIAKADLFGDHLLDDSQYALADEAFDPSTENPFASYLRKLEADLDRPGVVKVEHDDLSYGAPWLRFPDYDLCGDDLDNTTNGSLDARRALETGCARLTDIPEQLEGEEASEKRAAWLEDRLPEIYRNVEGKPMAGFAKLEATTPPEELEGLITKALEKRSSSDGNHETQDEGGEQ